MIPGKILLALTARCGTAAAQLIMLGCTALFLTGTEQGYAQVMNRLILLQVLLELGLPIVLVQVAGHECGRGNDRARLGWLVGFAGRWYLAAALALIATIGPGGWWYLAARPDLPMFAWLAPWCGTVITSALCLLLVPLFAILEGTGHVIAIALLRSAQALLGAVAFAIGTMFGLGLWALVLNLFVMLLVGGMGLILLRKPLLDMWITRPHRPIPWRQDVLPFQWRIALSWISGWFINQFYTVVIFSRDSEEAGRIGLSMLACQGLASLGNAWLSAEAPIWATLVGRGERHELERRFRHAASGSLLLMIGACVCFVCTIALAHAFDVPWANRFVDITSLSLLIMATIANQAVTAMAVWLRAHRQEPYLTISITGALAIVMWCLLAPAAWGTRGLLGGHLLITVVIGLGWGGIIFRRCRRNFT